MSGRKSKGDKKKKSSLYTVVYIVVVLALIGCLAFLVVNSRKRREEFEQKVREAAMGETEYVLEERPRETESEPEPETQEATEPESESEPETEDMDVSILLLNGTRMPGVAAYWKAQLELAGYKNVSSATYAQESGERTSIYYAEGTPVRSALSLQRFFPGADISAGNPSAGIEPEEGGILPGQIGLYVVIGRGDAEIG